MIYAPNGDATDEMTMAAVGTHQTPGLRRGTLFPTLLLDTFTACLQIRRSELWCTSEVRQMRI